MPRRWLVLAHRWTGLFVAAFLVVAGSTGAVLAWSDDLEPLTAPRLFVTAAAPSGVRPLDPLTLRERVAAAYPNAAVTMVPLDTLPGRTAGFFLSPLAGHSAPADDEVFLDPVSGHIVGSRRWGDITQGTCNLLPFLLRLHYSLALGAVGETAFGIVALLWTLDCFVGAWLTFPIRLSTAGSGAARKGWWSRWRPSWRMRLWSGGHKLTFDLHRAGGLWLWAFLLVFAWSSVDLTLRPVYRPLTRALLGYRDGYDALPERSGPETPGLSFRHGYLIARAAMVAELARRGQQIRSEHRLSFDRAKRLFAYRVRASDDVSLTGDTTLYIDADSGRVAGGDMPVTGPAGNRVTTWIESLHTADAFGRGYRVIVSVVGAGVVLLSVTGLLIWRRKRRSGRRRRPDGR
ncbi:PepSY-associated TM helix domain-containing protein [Sphingomonas sp. 8AM]|uniref:PepSY-associated TM helix domain-containing protein n=1 Tax=Sphingomonas sp. 8AM TaxID=2653170 RepID=UPI0012F0C113|nr:PepSY-associated TM helix domain-containing protein [Sphingomonas sp. 8AM]VXC99431.1 conserved hypothetical protein [Sphingomonas sp. 8AM]